MELDFNKIFASASKRGELIDFPPEDYLRGWGYLGKNVAPPMEYFNYLHALSDEKDLFLFTTKADKEELETKYQLRNKLFTITYENKKYKYDGSKDVSLNIDLATDAEIIAIVEG